MRQLGRYRLRRPLGSGSFATVWEAWDPDLETAVAVKVLADNWALDADVRERFLAEARLLRQVADPRVVRVHDVGIADDRPYFVMDYVDGGTLADLVGRLEPAAALRYAAEAALAVQALHDAGFVHRDVKPTNLLLARETGAAQVLVADLGSAKRLADASGYTVTTGTPAYMAPEQAGHRGGFDGRADVYALAVVTYELLTGHRPFEAAELRRRSRPAPVAAGLGLPRRLDDLLAAALDADPARRPQDARTFARLLTGAGAGGRARPGWPPARLAAAAGAAFAVTAGVTWWFR